MDRKALFRFAPLQGQTAQRHLPEQHPDFTQLSGMYLEDGVTYEDEKHGVTPLPQVNKAKRIEIGCRIYMALNPTIKVMFVEGHHFDEETQAGIEAAVEDKDFQLFEEVIEGETGIVLEDGTLKE